MKKFKIFKLGLLFLFFCFTISKSMEHSENSLFRPIALIPVVDSCKTVNPVPLKPAHINAGLERYINLEIKYLKVIEARYLEDIKLLENKINNNFYRLCYVSKEVYLTEELTKIKRYIELFFIDFFWKIRNSLTDLASHNDLEKESIKKLILKAEAFRLDLLQNFEAKKEELFQLID